MCFLINTNLFGAKIFKLLLYFIKESEPTIIYYSLEIQCYSKISDTKLIRVRLDNSDL
jgi:hypothetical protein